MKRNIALLQSEKNEKVQALANYYQNQLTYRLEKP